jgi:signal transduction histidine kinase
MAKAHSFGIRGLQERAATVGGWIDLSSSKQGTTLILSIPIANGTQEPPDVPDDEAEREHDPSAWGNL